LENSLDRNKIAEMMEMIKDIALEFINAFDLIEIKGIGKIA